MTNTSQTKRVLGRNILKRMVQVVFMVVFQAVVLILSSGRLNWAWAWAFIGLYLIGILVNAIFLLHYSPETIAERARASGMKNWDRMIGGLWTVMHFVVMLLIAGLDERFGWTGPIPFPLHLARGAIFVLGFALFSWAMISDAYFATVVRIQNDRGHTVCATGPYRFVRHPGYVGAIIQFFAIPV